MLDDLRVLLAGMPASAPRAEYADQVLAQNLLGKPTKKARERAWRHLSTLYGLEKRLAADHPDRFSAASLKSKRNISRDKGCGKDVASAPWFKVFGGARINDHHLTRAEKRLAKKR